MSWRLPNWFLPLCIFSLLFSFSNSTGDAIKFSGAAGDSKVWDLIWHLVKYLMQIPFCMIVGYKIGRLHDSVPGGLVDIFHPKVEHFWLLGVGITCVGFWQVNYTLWRHLISTVFRF